MKYIFSSIAGKRIINRTHHQDSLVIIIDTDRTDILYYSLSNVYQLLKCTKKDKCAIFYSRPINESAIKRILREINFSLIRISEKKKKHLINYINSKKNWLGEFHRDSLYNYRILSEYDSVGLDLSKMLDSKTYDNQYLICDRILMLEKPVLSKIDTNDFDYFNKEIFNYVL